MQRSQVVQSSNGVTAIVLSAIVLFLLPVAWAADGSRGSVLSGVVRDAQGVAQMGAVVQALAVGPMASQTTTAATTFTDNRGHYMIAHLLPGRYVVRASATLFVPATRTNLQLRVGATTIVNLTLAALFDTSSWLPAERRRADEKDDDWKWTLRSTANRPILRIVDNGSLIEVSTSASEARRKVNTKARATVSSGDGEFGSGGVHNILAIHRLMDDGGDMMLRADVGSTRVPSAYAPSQEFDGGYERASGYGSAARTVLSYKVHPEMVGSGSTTGLEVLQMTSGQRMVIGDLVEVEAGGRLEAVHTTRYGIATHPFVRVNVHPSGSWTLRYRLASDRGLQGFADITTGQGDVPVALVRGSKLALESGRHQEFAVTHGVSRGTVEVAYYRDAMQRTTISGGGAAGPAETIPSEIPDGLLVDPTTGSFRALGPGYSTGGVRVSASAPLWSGLWVAAEYSTGRAVASETGGAATFAEAAAGLRPQTAQSATVAVKGRLNHAGTKVRASYRWQPAHVVTAVDPYGGFSDQGFLSCLLQQPIRLGSHLPQGLNATVDVTNLLAEGYRPFVSADGQTLYFAQAPRTIQAGLSFTF